MMWMLALLAVAQAAQIPPRDQDPRAVHAQSGTAVLRGRVVDAETGDPVSRIPVRVSRKGQGRGQVVFSDAEGRFEFASLPAGTYFLLAESSPSRPAYLHAAYRKTHPAADTVSPPDDLDLQDEEVREGITLELPRARVITGRVLDDTGEPRAHARVEAELMDRGRYSMHKMASTDDLGAFRLFGLQPGRYRVCATPSEHGVPDTEIGTISEGLAKTCYPSTTMESDATPVVVTSGNADVEIRFQRTRLFTVSGVVLDASGAPAEKASVSLVTIEKHGSSGRCVEMKGATFIGRAVAPGNYAIRAQNGDPFDPADSSERQMAYVPFRVDAADVEHLVVAMKRPAIVTGRIIFEGGTPPASGGLRVRAHADEDSQQMQDFGRGPGSAVRDDLTFELRGLFGRYTLGLDSLPRGWVVKAVRYRVEDITEVPTEFASGTGPSELMVVVSNRPARMVARVLDEQGNPTPSAVVVVVPADKRAWATRPMRMRMIFARDGVYEDASLRPGEYYVAAVRPEDMPSSDDRERLEAIATIGEKVTFLENDQRVVDLHVARPPER
jgi:hypothetical protein